MRIGFDENKKQTSNVERSTSNIESKQLQLQPPVSDPSAPGLTSCLQVSAVFCRLGIQRSTLDVGRSAFNVHLLNKKSAHRADFW